MNKNEKWVKINGFEHYEISNYGRVKRLAHYVTTKNKWGAYEKHYDEYIKKPSLCGGNKNKDRGIYFYVNLTDNNGIQTLFAVHRLVATYFCDNPNNYTEVDHIDRNPQNNFYKNLRWVSRIENCNNRTIKKGGK